MSSLLFTALLNEQNINAINFDVQKVLFTNSNFLKAEPIIQEIKTNCAEFLLPLCDQHTIVTQGFIGRDQTGATTILGMESSDYTAALLAEALEADHFAIWTDVPGILTLDPKIAPEAQPVSELSFNEAAELAIFGAKILHPATLQPAIRSNIKFCVGSSQDSKHKTWVANETEDNSAVLRAISLRNNQILLTVKDISNTHTRKFLAALFNVFAKHNIDLDLVASNNISAQVVIDDNQKQLTEESLLTEELVTELSNIGQVSIERNLSLIAVIGKNIQQHQQVEASLFDFLKTNNIRSVFYGVSSHSICFLLNSSIAKDVARQLHAILFKFVREE